MSKALLRFWYVKFCILFASCRFSPFFYATLNKLLLAWGKPFIDINPIYFDGEILFALVVVQRKVWWLTTHKNIFPTKRFSCFLDQFADNECDGALKENNWLKLSSIIWLILQRFISSQWIKFCWSHQIHK